MAILNSGSMAVVQDEHAQLRHLSVHHRKHDIPLGVGTRCGTVVTHTTPIRSATNVPTRNPCGFVWVQGKHKQAS